MMFVSVGYDPSLWSTMLAYDVYAPSRKHVFPISGAYYLSCQFVMLAFDSYAPSYLFVVSVSDAYVASYPFVGDAWQRIGRHTQYHWHLVMLASDSSIPSYYPKNISHISYF